LLRLPVHEISDEAACGAANVVKVHRIRAYARELGWLVIRRTAALGAGHHFADGPPAQTARAEGESAEEPVVQLRPFLAARELRHDRGIQRRLGSPKEGRGIGNGRFPQLSPLSRRFEHGIPVSIRAHPANFAMASCIANGGEEKRLPGAAFNGLVIV
jgi:hypothetical protein